ncbi:MAG: ribosome silencing factor [Thiohalomonadales bacterium]
MTQQELVTLVVDALEERKAQAISVIDVMGKTSVTDTMIIASGTSSRQVAAIAQNVIECAKNKHLIPLGVEGSKAAEWVLVDLGDVVVHVMQRETREFYQLEKLWGTESVERSGTQL